MSIGDFESSENDNRRQRLQTRTWELPSIDEIEVLEAQLLTSAFAFIKDNYSAEVAQRLQLNSVTERGKALLNNVIVVTFSATAGIGQDDTEQILKESKSTLRTLTKMSQLMNAIPEGARRRYNRYNDANEKSFLGADVRKALEEATGYFRSRSRAVRGRKPDLVLALATAECIAALEFLLDRKFIRNFDAHGVGAAAEFLNHDSRFCESVLKLINPTLTHSEIKAALKTHFADGI